MSCRQQNPHWAGRIEVQDGIVIVRNPGNPMHDGEILTLEEDLSIGQDNEKAEYLFSRVNGITVDNEGRIYVVDDSDSNIRVFDKNGGYLRTIGRKGQGPGEFERPLYIQITADDELYVVDYSGARAVYFSLEGDYLRQEPLPRPILPIRRDSQGNLVGIEIAAPPPLGGKVIKKYDSHLKPLMVLATEDMGTRGVFDIGRPSCYCAVTPNDHVIWGDSKEYVLYVLDPEGNLIKKIIKEYDPLRISAAERNIYEKRYSEPIKAGMKISFRDHFPAFSDIFTDDKGRIWVKTYKRVGQDEKSFYFDVFNVDGNYIANVPLKISLDRTSVWKQNKLYALMDSPEGYPMVKRYQVTWKD